MLTCILSVLAYCELHIARLASWLRNKVGQRVQCQRVSNFCLTSWLLGPGVPGPGFTISFFGMVRSGPVRVLFLGMRFGVVCSGHYNYKCLLKIDINSESPARQPPPPPTSDPSSAPVLRPCGDCGLGLQRSNCGTVGRGPGAHVLLALRATSTRVYPPTPIWNCDEIRIQALGMVRQERVGLVRATSQVTERRSSVLAMLSGSSGKLQRKLPHASKPTSTRSGQARTWRGSMLTGKRCSDKAELLARAPIHFVRVGPRSKRDVRF